MLNDIEIAQQAETKNIKEVAAKLDIKEDDIEMYGKYKAKLSDELIASVQKNEHVRKVLAEMGCKGDHGVLPVGV